MNYFLEGFDIGYRDLGSYQSKYTAMFFAKVLAKALNTNRAYNLRTQNDRIVAVIRSTPKAPHIFIRGAIDA
jgi:hypothetical protein